MLDFEKELERFKPMLNINRIEEQLEKEPLEDVIDVFKSFQKDLSEEKYMMRKEG